MWVISPWSRGGFVNSQVFDHTSTLRFPEKRFGVVEPQIGACRRANLWVPGPNGYHRAFAGRLADTHDGARPEMEIDYERHEPARLIVRLVNRGGRPCTFMAAANAYRNDGPWTLKVAGQSAGELRWPVAASGNWHDFTVSCDASAAFRRRFAGRIETGRDSVSDPAMGTHETHEPPAPPSAL